RDVDPVALPLEGEGRGPGGGDGEGGRAADRHRLAHRLGGDARGLAARELDLEDGARVAGQVVEAPVRAHVEVHRRGDAGGEAGGGEVAGVQEADPAAAEVGEEVVAHERGRELRVGRVVDRAAGDRATGGPAAAVAVEEERPPLVRIAGGALAV